jgi:hypothetical protein
MHLADAVVRFSKDTSGGEAQQLFRFDLTDAHPWPVVVVRGPSLAEPGGGSGSFKLRATNRGSRISRTLATVTTNTTQMIDDVVNVAAVVDAVGSSHVVLTKLAGYGLSDRRLRRSFG